MNPDQQDNSTDIAVIGMGGRFPGADDIDEFRDNLFNGRESIRFLSDHELLERGVDPGLIGSPEYINAAASIEGMENFDHAFFGFIPRDAELMDPQLRLLLECAWTTLEHAGCNPETCTGAIGVFAGAAPNTYFQENLLPNRKLMQTLNAPLAPLSIYTASDALSTMISFKLNLRGPSITVQTACSTSLVAVHLACQSLLSGECSLALAGGVNLTVPQGRGYYFQEGMILSPDGHCRPFDARAAGTIFGDGLGMVLLKRLADALADGDYIHAVIKGSAVNNDGSQKAGFTAPSVVGQAAAMAEALSVAGVSADSIGYVEAHGTGTALGDPIELEALTRAFRHTSKRVGYCGIGSVKSNIGHLDRAAGIASLIKTVLAVESGRLPPTLHFQTPNPRIDFANSPFRVIDKPVSWDSTGAPRRAAVNSVGFGGTNACVVLEEAPARATNSSSRSHQVLVLSARTDTALREAARKLADHLIQHPETDLADASHTLQTGRAEFEFRRALVCSSTSEAVQLLQNSDARQVASGACPSITPSVIFMFPGQGSQYAGMGQGLYTSEPVFRSAVDKCADLLQSELDIDMRDIFTPAADRHAWIAESLQDIRIAQPALFIMEYALANLWLSWGVKPSRMIGHSVGEYVAACLSGVFALEDALRLVAARARLVHALPRGAMVAVRLPEAELQTLLGDTLAIAAVNAPSLSVVSGPPEEVGALERTLTARHVATVRLQSSHAFHSAMVEPAIADFRRCLDGISWGKPVIPFVSNVTGQAADAALVTRPEYWVDHLREGVRFCDGMATLLASDACVCLEVGPGMALAQMVRQNPAMRTDTVVIAPLGSARSREQELPPMLGALGQLWVQGVPIDWRGFRAGEQRRLIPLPTYCFERHRSWIERDDTSEPSSPHPGARLSTAAVISPPADAEPEAIEPLTASSCNGSEEGANGRAGRESLIARLSEILEQLSGVDKEGIEEHRTFLEMGFDSLFLSQFSRRLEHEFGASVSFVEMAEDLCTLQRLADHLQVTPSPAFSKQNGTLAIQPAFHTDNRVSAPREVELANELRVMLHQLSGIALCDISDSRTFLEMGLDSLFLAQLSAQIDRRFHITINFGQLVDDLSTLPILARHLNQHLLRASRPTAEDSSTIEQLREQIRQLKSELEVWRRRASGSPNISMSTSTNAPRAAASSHDDIALPLTAGQREIWLAAQLGDNASRAYNELVVIHLEGDLNTTALKQSVQDLVDRHDALRTTFSETGDQQFVRARRVQDLTILDIAEAPPGGAELHVQKLIERLNRVVLDTRRGPLMRAHLIRRAPNHHILHLAFHHVVVDGWSTHVIATELSKLYSARVCQKECDLGAPMTYSDYVEWYFDSRTESRRIADTKYWQARLGDLPKAVDLPTSHARPTSKSYRAGHAETTMEEALYRKLKKTSAQFNCTLFQFLLATFKIWIHRTTSQEDIIVGTPVAGHVASGLQQFSGCEHLVGHCANMLPIRTRLSPDSPFEETLRSVKQAVLHARAHECISYGELLETMDFPRDPGHLPLISVTFNLNDTPHIEWQGVRSTVEVPPKPCIFFDLEINIWEAADSLHVACYFASELFDTLTIQDWLKQWRTLLEAAADAPATDIGSLPLLSPDERRRLLVDWNETAREFPREAVVHRLFEQQVDRTPDAIAVADSNGHLTYADLDQRSNQLARHLQQLGVGPEVLVGISLGRSTDMMIALLGVLKAGGAYVPLDPAYPQDRISYVLDDARAQVLITGRDAQNASCDLAAEVVHLERDASRLASLPGERVTAQTTSANLAYLIYTSGSTGRPKGVQIEHRALVNLLLSMAREPGLTADDVVLAVTTLSFDIAGLELFLPLLVGATTVIAPREVTIDGFALARELQNRRITVMQATPATWRLMLEAGWEGTPGLKCLCGGEALPRDLAKKLLPRVRELWNMYGPTETTIWSTCCRVHDPDTVHIGRPIDNTETFVVDSRMRPVPVGTPGELLIGGEGLARGYRGRDVLTAEKFVPHLFQEGSRLYRTGDLARFRPDGNIECLGRLDSQVKVRGFRVEPGEIEGILLQHPSVLEAVVCAQENGSGDTRLVAHLVYRSGSACTDEELRQMLRKHLPEYMIPSVFSPISSLPLTPNGKIDRKSLPEVRLTESKPATATPADLPRNASEATICRIWSEVLRHPVGINDDFFCLGGKSLEAVSSIVRLRQALGIEIAVATLFENPTPAALAACLNSAVPVPEPPTHVS